jgi:hypothetical protein
MSKKETNGSLEGSHHVLKQSTGTDWCPAGEERGSGNATPGVSVEKHAQKKAKTVAPINAGGR